MNSPDPNEVDELMDQLPLLSTRYAEVVDKEPPLSEDDLSVIIAYHRKNRAFLAEGGTKAKGKKALGTAKTKIDLGALGLLKAAPPVAPVKRRF